MHCGSLCTFLEMSPAIRVCVFFTLAQVFTPQRQRDGAVLDIDLDVGEMC